MEKRRSHQYSSRLCILRRSEIRYTDSMDVVLFSDQLLGSDHESIQTQDDTERRRDANREVPTRNTR